MTTKKIINDELNAIDNPSESIQQKNSAAKMQMANQLANTTVNISVGGTKNGFTTLAVNVDDILDEVNDKVEQISDGIAIVQMTNAVGQVTSDLTKDTTSGTKTTIDSITGTSDLSQKSFSAVVISSGTPNAVAAAVNKRVANASPDQLKTIARGQVNFEKVSINRDNVKVAFLRGIIQPSELVTSFQNLLNDSIADSLQSSNGLKPLSGALTALKLATFAAIGRSKLGALALFAFGFTGLLQNIVEKVVSPTRIKLESLPGKGSAKISLPEKQVVEVIKLTKAGKVEAAAKIVGKYTDAPQGDIENTLRTIDNSISANTRNPNTLVSTEVNDFSKVSSMFTENLPIPTEYFKHTTIFLKQDDGQELQNELSTLKREVTQVVVTSQLGNYNAQEYTTSVYEQNKSNTNYHYLITRDGQLQRMRPVGMESVPVRSLPNNHNERTIFVVLIKKDIKDLDFAETAALFTDAYTPQTLETLREFWRITTLVYPGMEVLGYSEINPTGIGVRRGVNVLLNPGFTVATYLKANNIIEDPSTRGPLTREEKVNGGSH